MSYELIMSIKKHDEYNICGFFHEYRWLSNFHLCEIEYEGLIYPSSENAYQAAKCKNLDQRVEFTTVSPSKSKAMGKQLLLDGLIVDNWDDDKKFIMYRINRIKYQTHEYLRALLIETGEKYLEESNYWKDSEWGVYEGNGKNMLGKILMNVRAELLGNSPPYKFNIGFDIG